MKNWIGIFVFALAGLTSTQVAGKPNILLIMADDMGYECVTANGGESYSTPNLDRLARGGMRFEHCYSQPICTPSRVQLMTGIYNQRNYIRFGLLDPTVTTFGHLAKRAGYATCIGGKWQLESGLKGPNHFGFDEYCLWQVTRRPSRYPNPGLAVNSTLRDYDSGEYGPDLVVDYLCDFLERKKDEPFFLYYPMILPHWPFEPTPDSADWNPKAKGVLNGQGRKKYFVDMVAYTDKMVGRLVAKLEELGLRENTLVLFTGDNGTAVGVESILNGKVVIGAKGQPIDTGNHVPFIANWPGTIPAGKVNRDLVDFSDFMPTICDTIGASVPSKLKIDGRSFLPQLHGKTGSPREWTYCWYSRNGGMKGDEYARTQRYKLHRDGRFIDVANDPLEVKPIDTGKLDNAQRKILAMLQKVLAEKKGTRTRFDLKKYKKKL